MVQKTKKHIPIYVFFTFLLASYATANYQEDERFILGKSLFHRPWVAAPAATTARDGLGPLFNANSCTTCHPKLKRGTTFNKNGTMSQSLVVRLFVPAVAFGHKPYQRSFKTKGKFAEPNYGEQINTNANGDIKPEAVPKLTPKGVSLTGLSYRTLHPSTTISMHIAPALFGLGLINQIPKAQILASEDIDDKNNDGISGRANQVWHIKTATLSLGRFGHKATMPDLSQQIAQAAHQDMGLTNPLYPQENCTPIQCPKSSGLTAEFDLPQNRLEAITFYIAQQIPPKKKYNKSDLVLLHKIACTNCHRPSYQLTNGTKITPFSDFLLHDMGEKLKGEAIFLAQENEWRTAPLWGLSRAKNFLHDGRAKTIQEAIKMHEGEASKSRQNFLNLSDKKQQQLLTFLQSL